MIKDWKSFGQTGPNHTPGSGFGSSRYRKRASRAARDVTGEEFFCEAEIKGEVAKIDWTGEGVPGGEGDVSSRSPISVRLSELPLLLDGLWCLMENGMVA